MINDFNKELSAHAPSLADALGVRPGITSIIKNNLADSLGVRPGITAIIGSGGKTSLMRAFSRQLSAGGSRVLLTTTTHILPFKDMPCLRISMKEDASWVLDRLAEYNSRAWEICFGSGLLPDCSAGFVKSFEGSSLEDAPFNPKLSEPGFPLYELLPGADYIFAEAGDPGAVRTDNSRHRRAGVRHARVGGCASPGNLLPVDRNTTGGHCDAGPLCRISVPGIGGRAFFRLHSHQWS